MASASEPDPPGTGATQPLLEVGNLHVRFPSPGGQRRAVVRDISFSIEQGEKIAIVGESGSGKSMTLMALLGLTPQGSSVTGSIRFDGQQLVGLPDHALRQVRGRRMGLIPQDASGALSPLRTIGSQMDEALRLHTSLDRRARRERSVQLLEQVLLSDPELRLRQKGYSLSGGMAQRAMIASVLGPGPSLLLADEPTSALDATTAAEVLVLLDSIVREEAMAMLLVTHDLHIVRTFAERVVVMYQGRVVETAGTRELFHSPQHDYTKSLLASLPGREARVGTSSRAGAAPGPARRGLQEASRTVPAGAAQTRVAVPLLAVDGLSRTFELSRRESRATRSGTSLRALDGVSLSVGRGEVVAVVGESGSGKSTLARLVLGLDQPTSGRVAFDGVDVTRRRSRAMQREMQAVFQNPSASLDPRMRVDEIVAEPMKVHSFGDKASQRARMLSLLQRVGLSGSFASRYPWQLSGGQQQRVAIARALSSSPSLIVCDEPVTALDASVQSQILSLLSEIRRDDDLALLFIAHDLTAVEEIADRVVVMYMGRIVEQAPSLEFFRAPRHPYSQALLKAMHRLHGTAGTNEAGGVLEGDLPSPLNPPTGCHLHPRCWKSDDLCRATAPALAGSSTGSSTVACHHPTEVLANGQPLSRLSDTK